MTKILIIDTQGPGFTPEFRALLPGITLRGIEPVSVKGTQCHEHGAFCAWLAAIPLVGAGLRAEVVAIRVFDQAARWVADFDWLIAQIRAECEAVPPGGRIYTSRSWGAWDEDNRFAESGARNEFSNFTAKFMALQAEFGIVDFGAAGNEDENDADNDVDFPQRDMVETTCIVGARDRGGVTMPWSGDGRGVACVMWAHQVYSPDLTCTWRLWSGTSAATPKACGAAAALGYTFAQLNHHLVHLPAGSRPAGDWVLPHPKWGFGDFEDAWQNQARRVPPGLLPPAVRPSIRGGRRVEPQIEFHDYREVGHGVAQTRAGAAPAGAADSVDPDQPRKRAGRKPKG